MHNSLVCEAVYNLLQSVNFTFLYKRNVFNVTVIYIYLHSYSVIVGNHQFKKIYISGFLHSRGDAYVQINSQSKHYQSVHPEDSTSDTRTFQHEGLCRLHCCADKVTGTQSSQRTEKASPIFNYSSNCEQYKQYCVSVQLTISSKVSVDFK